MGLRDGTCELVDLNAAAVVGVDGLEEIGKLAVGQLLVADEARELLQREVAIVLRTAHTANARASARVSPTARVCRLPSDARSCRPDERCLG